MFDSSIAVLFFLLLSVVTSLIAVLIRLYRWQELTTPSHIPARLMLSLALSGYFLSSLFSSPLLFSFLFLSLSSVPSLTYIFIDLVACTAWIIEFFHDFCPELLVFKVTGYMCAVSLTNCIGMFFPPLPLLLLLLLLLTVDFVFKGIQLVCMVKKWRVNEKYYYIISFGWPLLSCKISPSPSSHSPSHFSPPSPPIYLIYLFSSLSSSILVIVWLSSHLYNDSPAPS